MGKKKTGQPPGPPPLQINWEEFDKLCILQCTLAEFACYFNTSEDSIERAVKRDKSIGFADYYEQKRQHGKISLRRKMFSQALTDGGAMAIFLSKQPRYLNFSDQVKNVNVEETSEETKQLAAEISRLITSKK